MKRSAPIPPSKNPVVPSSVKPTNSQDSEPNDHTNDNEDEDDDSLIDENRKLNERIANLENLIKSITSSSTSPSTSQGFTSSSATASSSSTSPFEQATPDVIPKTNSTTRSVPRKNYNNTSASVSAMLVNNKITSSTKDSFVKISLVRGGLSTAGLKTLLDGQRKEPVVTESNIYGYTERSITTCIVTDEFTGMSKSVQILLEEDDIFYFIYDCGRLYQAIIEIFGTSLHYLVPQEIEDSNGRGMYLKIMAHLNGQRGRDIDIAKENFNQYKMNPALTFKQEHSKFEEIFKTLEYAQCKPLTESEKMQFLQKRLKTDIRIGMKDVMIQATINDYDYTTTVKMLTKVNCELSDTEQTMKLANTTYSRPKHNENPRYNNSKGDNQYVKTTKYCYNFNETGECPFGHSCKYEHIKNPNHVSREPRENSKTQSTVVASIPVTKTQRTPNQEGGGHSRNRSNYKGKRHPNKMNVVNSNEEIESAKQCVITTTHTPDLILPITPFESWGNCQSKPYQPLTKINEIESMKILTSNQSQQYTPFPSFLPTPQPPTPAHHRISAFTMRSKTLIRVQYLQMQHARRHRGSEIKYAEEIHCMPLKTQERYFARSLIHLRYPCNVEYEAEDGGVISTFTGFGWNPRCPITGKVIEEMRNPSASVMEMVYRVNEIVLNAEVCHATAVKITSREHAGSFKIERYMNFIDKWYLQGTPGHYQSTFTSVNDYIEILSRIKIEASDRRRDKDGNIHFAESTIMIILWGLAFDFMSFAATKYKYNLDNEGMILQDSKCQLTNEIMSHEEEKYEYKDMKNIFLNIAAHSKILANHADYGGDDDNDLGQFSEYESEAESSSESDTEYIRVPTDSHTKFRRMSIYSQADKRLSTQRKYIFMSAEDIKSEKYL